MFQTCIRLHARLVTHHITAWKNLSSTRNDMDLQLDEQPRHLPELCCGVSKSFIDLLLDHLPTDGSLVLSVGCGSGLLEAILLREARAVGRCLNLSGVEVPTCQVQYLPAESVQRVAGTRDLHSNAVLATTLLFVYPRVPELIATYLGDCLDGALEQLVWVGPCSDWADSERILTRTFTDVKIFTGQAAGLPTYELMVIASVSVALDVN